MVVTCWVKGHTVLHVLITRPWYNWWGFLHFPFAKAQSYDVCEQCFNSCSETSERSSDGWGHLDEVLRFQESYSHISPNWLVRNFYQIWVVLESLSISCMVLLFKMGYHLTPGVASQKIDRFLASTTSLMQRLDFCHPGWVVLNIAPTEEKIPWNNECRCCFHDHFRIAAHESFHCQLHCLSICLETLLVLCFASVPPFFLARGDPIVRRCWARTEDPCEDNLFFPIGS